MHKEETFFEKYGLEVGFGEVEVGNTYPIYGMITKFIDDSIDNIIVEVNENITVKMAIPSQEKIDILKKRAFQPGIFVSKVLEINENTGIVVECSTVIFGKLTEECH